MKTLAIVAGVFFAICGVAVAYFAVSDAGNGYDLKFVLPIDTRQMPDAPPPPPVVALSESGEPILADAGGRAEEGAGTLAPQHAPLRFREGPDAASEVPPQE